MKRLIVGWATVLAVAVIVAIPALAQGVPDTPDTPPGKATGDEQVKSDEPITSPDVSPSPAAPPETTLPEPPPLEVPSSDVPLADVPPPLDAPPPSIGEQKAGDEGVANEAVEEQETGNGQVREAGDPEIGSRQAEREVEEQEVEDREVELDEIGKAGIGKGGIGKASAEKAGDPKQETEQDADSGDADQSVDVINTGDNVNLCLGVLQAANTGNAQNAQGVVQDGSEADEVELEDGSSITITPQLIVDCRQIIYQIVTGQQLGAGDRDATLRGGALRGGSNVPGFGQLALGTNRAALKVAGTSSTGLSKAAATRRSLPRTGGGTLLGLGAGVVLIAGGLSVRRIFR